MKSAPCEICQAGAGFWKQIKGYAYFRCCACGHVFVWPRPGLDALARYYADASYYDTAEVQLKRILAESESRFELLATYSQKLVLEPRLLDVGCASGHFLSVAKRHGWNVVGQDYSAEIAERAKQQYDLDVRVGPVEDSLLDSEIFPVVTAWEVIEHAREPQRFFESVGKLVKPGGLLALSTPMMDGFPAKLLGDKFPMLIPPEHLSLFSRKSIRKLAECNGFEQIHFSSFSNLRVGNLASGLSRLLFKRDLDYAPGFLRAFCLMVAMMFAWAPTLMDRLGYGTEMLLLFRKKQHG